MYCRLRGVFEFLRNERLLDLVEGIVGPEITCSPIQHARAKLPDSLRRAADDEESRRKREAMVGENVAPWHQDAQVHLEAADPHAIVTVWVPLVDATPANGCLQVIPGVHRRRRVYWSEGFGVSDQHLPEDEPVTLHMRAGDLPAAREVFADWETALPDDPLLARMRAEWRRRARNDHGKAPGL